MAGKRDLVTGASTGLGAHSAHVLAQHGAQVVAAARCLDAIEALAARVAGARAAQLRALVLDVSDAASRRRHRSGGTD